MSLLPAVYNRQLAQLSSPQYLLKQKQQQEEYNKTWGRRDKLEKNARIASLTRKATPAQRIISIMANSRNTGRKSAGQSENILGQKFENLQALTAKLNNAELDRIEKGENENKLNHIISILSEQESESKTPLLDELISKRTSTGITNNSTTRDDEARFHEYLRKLQEKYPQCKIDAIPKVGSPHSASTLWPQSFKSSGGINYYKKFKQEELRCAGMQGGKHKIHRSRKSKKTRKIKRTQNLNTMIIHRKS